MTGRHILWMAGSDWWAHNPYSEQRYARLYALQGDLVLFVNSISVGMPSLRKFGVWKRVVRKLGSVGHFLRRVEDRLYVVTPVLAPAWSIGWIARVNTALLRIQIALAMRRIGMARPVAVFAIPTAAVLLDRLGISGIVYYVKDKYDTYHESMRFTRIADHDAALRARADALVCASMGVYEAYAPTHPHVYAVPHGVSEIFLAPLPPGEPPDIAGLPRPRVVYWGLLDRQIDAELVGTLADRRPAWTFVLVGPRTDVDETALARRNIVLLPKAPQAEIAAIGAVCDVAMLPRKDTDWNRYACPTKLREYLALGLPVVSVPVYEFDALFPGAVRTAIGADAWERELDAALADTGAEAAAGRRALVSSYTLADAAARFSAVIDTVCSAGSRERRRGNGDDATGSAAAAPPPGKESASGSAGTR